MDTLPSLEQAVASAATPAERVAALDALSTELARTGRARRALELAQQARQIATDSGDGLLDARSRHALGRCFFYLAEYVPALGFLLEAAPRYQELGDLAGAATAYGGVGLCQSRLGAHEDAVTSLQRALRMAREHGLVTLEINVLNSLVPALLAADRPDDAGRHLADGLALARGAGNDRLLTKLLHNAALVDRRRGDDLAAQGDAAGAARHYDQALVNLRGALDLAQRLGNVYDQAQTLGQSGIMLRLLGRFDEAHDALGRTLAMATGFDGHDVLAEATMELGLLHEAQGLLQAAHDCLAEAVDSARGMAAKPLLAEASLALSRVLEAMGDTAGALARYKEFHALREAELARSRKLAAAAADLWLDFQDAARREAWLRERAASLEADRDALQRQAQALDEVSRHDPLTGLLNRRGFEQRLDSVLQACRERRRPLALALIDVDLFKQVNDGFSHAVGDAVLRRVAENLRAHCRHHDLAVRWGGDEFLLVLAEADLDGGRHVLQRLRDAHAQCPWHEIAAGLNVTLSIGLAQTDAGLDVQGALAAADQALYQAKRLGRDRIAP